MKAYTIEVKKGKVEVFPFIAIDGEEYINGKFEKVIWIGDNRYIFLRNFEGDSFSACNFFTIGALDSDEFQLGDDILIPEVTVTTKRALIMLKFGIHVEIPEMKGVSFIEGGVDVWDVRRFLIMIHNGNKITIDGNKIQFQNGKLKVNGKVIE